MLAIGIMAISGIAFAHSGAEGVVKERMHRMSDIANSMKTIGKMIKGETGYDAEAAKTSALKIHGHMVHMEKLFPEGSTDKPSEALPAIWENWNEFLSIFDQLGSDAKQLADIAGAASSSDEIAAQFAKVGKSCGSCHEKFRLKK